jgi:O-acetyl-ADP-ribose deacetylase (regulator of RNase III)
MIDVTGDLWTYGQAPAYNLAITVTTNWTVTAQGKNVMGGGCAAEAAYRFPSLPLKYGERLERLGRHTHAFAPGAVGNVPWLVMMGVKSEVWHDASVNLIQLAANEMLLLANRLDWQEVIVPRPGCGLGGLDYDEHVRPILVEEWGDDDRFKVITFQA